MLVDFRRHASGPKDVREGVLLKATVEKCVEGRVPDKPSKRPKPEWWPFKYLWGGNKPYSRNAGVVDATNRLQ